jgi:hypothetical protein
MIEHYDRSGGLVARSNNLSTFDGYNNERYFLERYDPLFLQLGNKRTGLSVIGLLHIVE